jgi:aerobic-type carbon monoxide dehydrogenase small subunit (CoxS/CutS family)
MPESVSFKLNGKSVQLRTDAGRNLLWALRTDLALTGTKFGCGEGHCGSCTVLLNGVATRSCLLKLKDVKDKEVITIEGVATDGKLHPVQRAFIKHDALQCGFCTPGMILTAVALLQKNPQPTPKEILRGLENNLCRCGAHIRIIKAVLTAAAEMKGGA